MLPKARDRFEEWFRTPVADESSDPRFEVGRLRPSEFEAVYDLLDEAFGQRKRPRAVYDWLYRENPSGPARCSVVFEKRSGRMINTRGYWPWPMARGSEPVNGLLSGDQGTARDWQRQGAAGVQRRAWFLHPICRTETVIGWPNPKSLAVAQKYGWSSSVISGLLSEAILPLEKPALRQLRAMPQHIADAWRSRRRASRPHGRSGLTVEAVRRFDTGFDDVTRRCMEWDGFWCPHDAEFLNWRYLDHPTTSYRALAALEGDEVAGYCVIRADGKSALLMEFAAPESGEVPLLLVRGASDAAREAGCRRLSFHAPPGWRHWRTLRDAGFVDHRCQHCLSVENPSDPDVGRLENWQLVPGDGDNT
jgi:hypothetical protein